MAGNQIEALADEVGGVAAGLEDVVERETRSLQALQARCPHLQHYQCL